MHLEDLVDVGLDMYLDVVPCLDDVDAILVTHEAIFGDDFDLDLQEREKIP
jgi:hypothetical protein